MGIGKPFYNAVQRHIVIAGYDQHGGIWKTVEKLAGRDELIPPCSLSQIAADDNNIGLDFMGTAHGLFGNFRNKGGPKMQIGDVQDLKFRFFSCWFHNVDDVLGCGQLEALMKFKLQIRIYLSDHFWDLTMPEVMHSAYQ